VTLPSPPIRRHIRTARAAICNSQASERALGHLRHFGGGPDAAGSAVAIGGPA